MSRVVPVEEFDLIEQVISEHPEGIGISDLEKALALHLPKALNRRTLQRIHEGSVARFRLKLSYFQAWKPIRDQQRQPTFD